MRAFTYYATIAALAFGGTVLASVIAGRQASDEYAWLLKTLVVFLLVAMATGIFLRREGLGLDRYGVGHGTRAGHNALAGLTCGLVLGLLWAAVVWLWAPYSLMLNPVFTGRALIFGSAATVAMGLAEEIGYRTYGLDRLSVGFGPYVAVVASSIIFAVAHTTGGMPWLAAALVVGSSGILYGTLMLWTRSLPFVAAFHIGNNLLQDALLRTGVGSLWQPVFISPMLAQDRSLGIWSSMAALNLALAGAACWHWRQSGSALFARENRSIAPERTTAN